MMIRDELLGVLTHLRVLRALQRQAGGLDLQHVALCGPFDERVVRQRAGLGYGGVGSGRLLSRLLRLLGLLIRRLMRLLRLLRLSVWLL